MTLQEVRTMVSARLKDAGIEAYDYETWIFLDWMLGVSRADFYIDGGKEVDCRKLAGLNEMLEKREKHVPLQYLMGYCEFMGYEFLVDERVLIPRQDTECLVEEAVHFLRKKQEEDKKMERPVRVLDLCTGSGCIGLSIKLLCPNVQVVLSDLSGGALCVARKNRDALGVQAEILQGDLFAPLCTLPEEERKFDLIISNPPYIPTKVVEGLMPEVRDFEPHMALDGTEDGLEFYRKITEQAPDYLRKQGSLFYEIGSEQGKDVSDLMKKNGFSEVSVGKDLAGLDRIVRGRLLS